MGPFPLKMIEAGWNKLCQAAEITVGTPEERVEKLRSMSQEEIMQKCSPRTTFAPLADGKFLPLHGVLETHTQIAVARILSLAMSEWKGSYSTFYLRSSHKISSTGTSLLPLENLRMQSNFANTSASIPRKSKPRKHTEMRCASLFRLCFSTSQNRIAEIYERKAYHYHFEEPSPYDGKTHGLAVHGQDAVFVFNSERDTWPDSAQKVSLEMAKLWTSFAYGEEPWPQYSASKKFMRFGLAGQCSMRSFDEDETRDYRYMNWMRDHFDETMRLIMSLA